MDHDEATRAIRDYCGDFYDDLHTKIGDDGMVELVDLWRQLTDEQGDDDGQEVFNGLIQAAYGDLDLETAGAELLRARIAEAEATDRLRGVVLWESTRQTTAAEMARRSGVTRVTVGRWLS